MSDSKYISQFPILYTIGSDNFRDIPLEKVDKNYRQHYLEMKSFWERYYNFLEENPKMKHTKDLKQWSKNWINYNNGYTTKNKMG